MDIHKATEQAYKNGYEQGKKDALNEIIAVENKWIPVSDQLPKEECKCKTIVRFPNGSAYEVDLYYKNGRFFDVDVEDYTDNVTAWKPLLVLPKEEE